MICTMSFSNWFLFFNLIATLKFPNTMIYICMTRNEIYPKNIFLSVKKKKTNLQQLDITILINEYFLRAEGSFIKFIFMKYEQTVNK